MSYIGKRPNVNTLKFNPRSTDPVNPVEGEVQYADGTARPEGFYQYKDGAWRPLGNDAGLNLNYLKDSSSDAESSIGNWVTYADPASDRPTDGTGGTAIITLTRTTSVPLRGAGSFLITKDASNRQGEGVSIDITIDEADKNKPMLVSMDLSASANFVFGNLSDIRFFVYDVTNSQILSLFPNTIQNNGSFKGFFQASSSSSYRLIAHVATTSALAYTLKLDNIYFGPNQELFLAQNSDYKINPFVVKGTVTDPDMGTAEYAILAYRKNGKDMDMIIEYKQTVAGGSNGSGLYYIELPDGLEVDFEILKPESSYVTIVNGYVGSGTVGINGATSQNPFYFTLTNENPNRIYANYMVNTSTGQAQVWDPSNYVFNVGDLRISAKLKIPIKGWTSGYETPANTLQNVPATFSAEKPVAQSIPVSTFTKLSFDTIVKDSLNAWESLNSRYICVMPGDYIVNAAIEYATLVTTVGLAIYKNGTLLQSTFNRNDDFTQISSFPITLDVGDYLELFAWNNSGGAVNTSFVNQGTYLGIHKIESPNALINVVRTAVIRDVKVLNTDGGTFNNGDWRTRDLNDVKLDSSLVSLSSNQFTPIAGKYKIRVSAPAYQVEQHKIRLYNVTDLTSLTEGSSEYAGPGTLVVTRSELVWEFTTDGTKAYEIQHHSVGSQSGNGFGVAINVGDNEIYTIVELEKIA